MPNSSNWSLCEIVCCSIAAVIGLIVILATHGAIGTLAAVLAGVALGVMLYFVLTRVLCTARAEAAPTPREKTLAPAPAVKPKPEAAPPAPSEPEPEREPEGGPAAVPAVKSGVQLPGETELAARKGTWVYRGGPKPAAMVATPATPAAPAAAPAGERRPEGLAEPRGGVPDDLKQIKGVGPKLEKLLNSMGYFHFDQIAAWGPDEVAWVDQNLKGFRGRVSRDEWVAQASTLAAGGQTEFSRRVEDGGVYE